MNDGHNRLKMCINTSGLSSLPIRVGNTFRLCHRTNTRYKPNASSSSITFSFSNLINKLEYSYSLFYDRAVVVYNFVFLGMKKLACSFLTTVFSLGDESCRLASFLFSTFRMIIFLKN